MKILVADDSRILRLTLRGILEPLGHEVLEAANGREALDALLAPLAPHVAIIDWLMPEMDGPDVCSHVRSAGLAIQPFLILLTSKDSKADIIQGLGKGANDFLTKPFHEGELQARLAVGAWVVDLQTRLEALSHTDPLTGIRNRRSLLGQIGADAALVDRLHVAADAEHRGLASDLVFFMVDLDHFKQVNDQHGHHAGDVVLKETAARLQKITRKSDALVRWGGEEFLLVTRRTRREDAPIFAERLLACIASAPFVLETGEALSRTCSVGFAAYPLVPGLPGQPDWEAVLDLADQALYGAKRSGRNCWVGVTGVEHGPVPEPESTAVSITELFEHGQVQVTWSGGDPGSINWR